MRARFYFFSAVLCCLHLPAQVLQPRQYAVKDGLAHADVYRIFQDKQGFLWFSTDFGVSRFDGTAFRNDFPGVSNNAAVLSMEEYGNEKWFCLYGAGIRILEGNVAREPLVLNGKIPRVPVYSLHDTEGNVWIIELSGALSKLSGKKTEHILPGIKFRKMMKAKDGSLLFTSEKGVFRYTKKQGIQTYLRTIIPEAVFDLVEIAPGEYWLSEKGKILHVVNGVLAQQFETGKAEGSGAMARTPDGNIWYCAPSAGVLRIQNGQLHDYTEQLGLSGKIVNDLFCDKEGNLWLATHGDGVFCLHSADALYFPVEKNKIGLYANAITSWHNSLLLASLGTLSIYDSTLRPFPLKTLHTDDYIYCIKSEGDYLYAGTPTRTIICNPAAGTEEAVGFGAICWHKDDKGQTWLGGFRTVALLQRKGNAWETDTLKFPHRRRTNAITSDKQQLWLGTDSGLYVYRAQQVFPVAGFPDSMRYIKALLFDSQHRLWVASQHGLAVYAKNKWRFFSVKDGLCHDRCNALAEDRDGKIWVGTMRGLNCISLRDEKAGIETADITTEEILSVFIANDQVLWAGTVNGVISTTLHEQEPAIAAPAVYLLSAASALQQISNPQQIALAYTDRKLLLQFTAPAFRYPGKTEYRYRMLGLNDTWSLTAQRSLEFPALPPGAYTFVVEARQNRGDWGKPALLTITVARPFWLSGWFMAGSGVLAIGLLFFGTRFYFVKKIKAEKEKAAVTGKMLHLRQQALTAMINPHFIFNCLNSIQYFINRKDIRGSEDYLARFAKLVRLTIEDTRETNISLQREIHRLELYLELEQLRLGSKLKYSIHFPHGLENVLLPNMILQPYVENAIVHGIAPKQGNGNLCIRITEKETGLLQIEIEDDGVGFSKRSSLPEQHSLGMALTRERLDLMSRMSSMPFVVEVHEKKDAAGKTAGTLVQLCIPLLSGTHAA